WGHHCFFTNSFRARTCKGRHFLFLFFWSFFILSQIYMETIRKYVTEGILLPGSIILTAVSMYFISFATNVALFILAAILFGFFYGGLMNLFYNNIAVLRNNRSKKNAFALFGLMSYFGVGLGSFLLTPMAARSLTKVFLISSFFPLSAFMIYVTYSLMQRSKVNAKG